MSLVYSGVPGVVEVSKPPRVATPFATALPAYHRSRRGISGATPDCKVMSTFMSDEADVDPEVLLLVSRDAYLLPLSTSKQRPPGVPGWITSEMR